MEDKDQLLRELLQNTVEKPTISADFTTQVMKRIAAQENQIVKPLIGKYVWYFISAILAVLLILPVFQHIEFPATFSWEVLTQKTVDFFHAIQIPLVALLITGIIIIADDLLRKFKKISTH